MHLDSRGILEIWSYVGKKQRWVTPEDDRSRVGDMWTFVALDPDSKLVPAYWVHFNMVPVAPASRYLL